MTGLPVDPGSHNANPPGVFGGSALEWLTVDADRDAEGAEHRSLIHRAAWTGADAGLVSCGPL